jgi:glucan endo-1,6-beta-glucosidase
MSKAWGSGNATEYLPKGYSNVAAEDHRYVKWDTSVAVNHDAYLRAACKGSSATESPAFVTEWSLSVPDNVEGTSDWSTSGQKDFYRKVSCGGFREVTEG